MAIRTDSTAVEGIIEVDSSISLTPFIEVASSLVDSVCAASGYTAARLELIERWLAAHFYAIRDPRKDSEKAGPVSEKNQYKVDLGFDVTTYGQMAMRVDYEGNLAALNERVKSGQKRRIGVIWLVTGDSDGNDITGE